MAVTNAIIKAGKKALTKGSEKAIEKATTKAITKATEKAVNKALTKSVTRGLTGAGVSSLAPKAGSTLDGILGRSSGLTLPEPKVAPVSIAKEAEKLFPGENISTIGDMINKFEGSSLDKIYKNKGLSKKSYDTLKSGAREIADINNPLEQMNEFGVTAKSNLPTLNRQQYYEDTIGKLRNPDGSKNLYVSGKDVPDYMQNHLANDTTMGNDTILREFFGDHDNAKDMNELYEMYEKIAQGPNANEIYTPENIDAGVQLMGEEGRKAEQDFAERLFRGKKDIPISSSSSGAKNIKLSRPTADMGVDKAVAETPRITNPALANEIAELKAQVSSAGGGMRGGGGTPTATASPDYGGLGDSGFETKLNTGQSINVVAGDGGVRATKQQKGIRFIRDKTLKELNPTPRQYADLMGKSNSFGSHYEKVADRIKAENIVQANIAQKTEDMLNHIEGIKSEAFRLADELGLSVDLSGIDNAIGLKPFQKKQLSELGLNLNEIIGDKSFSASQADEIYRILKSYAYDMKGDKDTLRKQAGKALDDAANKVSDRINDVLDNMGVDYKKSFLDGAGVGGVGADGKYLRAISENPDKFKFSDLRREESDWINIGKVANRPIKEEKIPESITEAIGQGFKKGGEKIREKYYERQAYGAGGGNMGGGSVPPTGGFGAEGNINFETVGSGRTGTLGNLLGKAKSAGLVGAGVLGGMMLGGGGGGSNGGSTDFSAMSYSPNTTAEPEIDPYQTLTIGGYTYDQLEAGYTAALMAGDSDAAKLIANMMGMLDDKVERYNTAKKNSTDSSGIASKQRAALNVLSGLMQNYSAQGPIGGRFTGFMNALTGGGYNPSVAAYDSGAQGSLGTIIKALGDTGALSEGDQKRALELLPKTTDSEEAAKYKYQQLIQILQGAGAQ